MLSTTMLHESTMALCPTRMFVHRGMSHLLPNPLNYRKLVASIIYELIQKSEKEPDLEVYSHNVNQSQIETLCHFKKPPRRRFDQADFLSELDLHREETLSIWEGRQELIDYSRFSEDRTNYQDIISSKWHEKFNHINLPYFDLIVEEKPGRFSRLELQKQTYKEWQKKGYRPESGYGIIGLFKLSLDHNIIWRRYRSDNDTVSLTFARSFFPWLDSILKELTLEEHWAPRNFWLSCNNELVINLIADYGLEGGQNIFCPQISFGYHPIASFAACLMNLEKQVFIHIHGLGEIDIVVFK